ncbi:MAG: signal peptidase I [Eubacteriales bacterium]|nr:signal peptidase I [Eubacteriales bacterium]MDD3199629.1 signal peptidase I [Eubacteriales bacterium]MDD4629896.1 signal peptidase I [Eubacteriales bacterium]
MDTSDALINKNDKEKEKRGGNRIMQVIGILLCVVLIPMLVINLTLIIKSFSYPEQVPDFFGYKPFIVLSGSMEPVFYSGDLALARETPPENLSEGDIIAFREGNSVITHRIMTITSEEGERRYITKGDNNNVEDQIIVTDEKIEGVYLFSIDGLGNTAMFMQTPVGMIVFIALPLILFILYDIVRRRHYEKRERERTKELEEELAKMQQKLNEKDLNSIKKGQKP